jgi:hypothetical protein
VNGNESRPWQKEGPGEERGVMAAAPRCRYCGQVLENPRKKQKFCSRKKTGRNCRQLYRYHKRIHNRSQLSVARGSKAPTKSEKSEKKIFGLEAENEKSEKKIFGLGAESEKSEKKIFGLEGSNIFGLDETEKGFAEKSPTITPEKKSENRDQSRGDNVVDTKSNNQNGKQRETEEKKEVFIEKVVDTYIPPQPLIPINLYSKQERTFPEGFVHLLIDGKLYYNNNLKITYYLIHAQQASITDLSKELKINRRIIYDAISSNPCFITYVVKGLPSSEGGRQRIVALSEDAKLHILNIEELAFIRLGLDVCRELQVSAEKIRRKALLREKREHEKIEKYNRRLRALWRKRESGDFNRILYFLAEDFNKPIKEIISDMEEKAPEEGW